MSFTLRTTVDNKNTWGIFLKWKKKKNDVYFFFNILYRQWYLINFLKLNKQE